MCFPKHETQVKPCQVMHDGVILVQFDVIHVVKLDKALLVFRVLELCEVISLNKRIESNGHVELFYLVSC